MAIYSRVSHGNQINLAVVEAFYSTTLLMLYSWMGNDMNLWNRSILAVYRLPSSSASVFFDEFSLYLENIVMCPEPLVKPGDFNFHMDFVHSNDAIRFNKLLETFGLSQH